MLVDDDGEALRLKAPRNRLWSSEKEQELGPGAKTQAPSSEATYFLHVKSPSQRFSNLPNQHPQLRTRQPMAVFQVFHI